MSSQRLNRATLLALMAALALYAGGCVYWNTFYNAKKAFNEAEKTRKASRLRGGRVNTALYELAIEKSLKVVENHPNSKYYDDALFVLGVSYYYTNRFVSSERRFRELLANYEDSKYAKESELYLAKAKLELKDEKDAMEIFEKIFRTDFDPEFKAEAAMALGEYYFRDKDYGTARQYFGALRDSLGVLEEKRMAQRMIADSYLESYQFRDAQGAYIQLLGMEPEKEDKYHALYHAAEASFKLMQIERGLDYLSILADDEVYFDSLSAIKLLMAEGYEYDDDAAHAEDLYREVYEQDKERPRQGLAAYRLGLIYQFDYDDLPKAKEYYDEAAKLQRSSDFGRDALERSSSIGKIEEFKQSFPRDSATTTEVMEEAARVQYQLAELYWLELNKLDSAMIEMQYVVDSFPTSSLAPKAMVALAQMTRDRLDDSARARMMLQYVLYKYPHSDYVPEALEALGLLGTAADTGYAELYLKRAEAFLIDDNNIDSARYHYRYIVDNFPDSKYYPQARFSLIWLAETYDAPGDSSVYYAYAEFVDSFPNSPWAETAESRLMTEATASTAAEDGADTTASTSRDDPDEALRRRVEQTDDEPAEDTTVAEDPLEGVYIDPNGDRIANVEIEPIEIREEFVYPVEAYRLRWEGDLYFQIFLDFSGEVKDYILKRRSESEDINREASEAVASMIFDPLRIPQEQQDQWMVYKFQVRLPDHIR